MLQIKNEVVIMCDVDDTLVMHGEPLSGKRVVTVTDPYSLQAITMTVNTNMLRCVEEELSRGSFVVVWSKGGHRWAKAVMLALGFTEHERIIIMTKPRAYFDDKPVQEWLTDRVYLGPEVTYKK